MSELFMHVFTLHWLFRMSVLQFRKGEITAPVNHTKLTNVPIPVGYIKATGIYLA